MIPFGSDHLVQAAAPIAWDDPHCAGNQNNMWHCGPWCHRCSTGNGFTFVPFLGLWGKLPICWWCYGPMEKDKPTRTSQDTDRTIATTNLEPSAARREFWEAEVWGDWGDAA